MSDIEGTTPSREMRLISRSLQPLPPKTLKHETQFLARRSGVITLWSILVAFCTPPAIFTVVVVSFNFHIMRTRANRLAFLGPPCRTDSLRRGIFEVNLAFGSFTYLQAKSLDAAWNLLAGKTSQAVAAWICYKIFAMALLRITERSKVSVKLYTATTFYPTDVLTLWKYVRGLAVSRTARERAILIWFCFAVAYVLALTTILDLVTGYVETQEATITLVDGSLAPFDQLRWLNGTYKDLNYYASPQWITETDTLVHTLSGQKFTCSDLIDNSTSYWKTPPLVCVPAQKYQWGFSLGWLYVLLLSTMIWAWGMYGMYVDARKHDLLWQMGRQPGVYRDILDVAEALQEELGPDTCGYSDKELSREIEKLDPVGFVVEQEEGNVRGVRLSTRISDIYDGVRNENMSCERWGTATSPQYG